MGTAAGPLTIAFVTRVINRPGQATGMGGVLLLSQRAARVSSAGADEDIPSHTVWADEVWVGWDVTSHIQQGMKV